MSSQESREARQKRLARQAQGSRDVLRTRPRRKPQEPPPGPSKSELAAEPWADGYLGEEVVHDEQYYLDGEHELNFEDD